MNNRHRALALLLAAALTTAGAVQPAAAFSDVTDPDTSLAVSVLEGMGIVSGYDDGNYHPDASLTRAEFAKLAVLAMGLSGQVSAAGHRTLFNDVPASHWAAGYVNLAYDQGIVNGYGNGSFGPADAVTYDQVVTILLRLLGYTSADIGPFWPADYLAFADDLGLNDGLDLTGGDAVNRGEAALLLYRALQCDTKEGQTYALTTAQQAVEDVILLSVSATADDGRTGAVQVLSNGKILYYDQKNPLPDELSGQSGTLLLDQSGDVTGFLPDGSASRTVSIAAVTAAGITGKDGAGYSVPASAALVWQGSVYQWETGFANVKAGGSAILYYNTAGDISAVYLPSASDSEAVVLSASPTAATLGASFGLGDSGWSLTKNGASTQCADLAAWDVVTYDAASRTLIASDCRLTGYLEDLYPSADAPTSVTIAGLTLPVLPCARESFAGFSGGDQVTLLLTDGGQVAMALSPSELQAEMIGLMAADGRSVTLSSGLTLSGEFDGADTLAGSVVKVLSDGVGSFTVKALSGGVTPARLDLTEGVMGEYPLAPSVTCYEWAGSGYAVQISLSDLSGTVSASDISYAHCNDAGQIDLLVLDAVTGSCYTYGFAVTGTQVSVGVSGFVYSNGTVSVRNSAGTSSAYLTAASIKDDAAIGISGSASGKLAGMVTLAKATGIVRDDFNGLTSVNINGVEYPISDQVQVYNSDTEQWTTLEKAKAYGSSFTLYFDRTTAQGGQVRIITVTQ